MTPKGSGPLAGKRVVVTRARSQSEGLAAGLEAAGGIVVELPLIRVTEPESWEPVDAAIARLVAGDYHWVAFTSTNGVDSFLARIASRMAIAEAFTSARVAAVGSATQRRLEQLGVPVSFVPARFTAESMATGLGPGRDSFSGPAEPGPGRFSGPAEPGPGLVLLPRAASVPPALRAAIEAQGWAVDEVAVYRTVAESPGTPGARAVRAGAFDVVTFTSGSTARHFVELMGPPQALGLAPDDEGRKIVACIGPVTSSVAAGLGFKVDVVAEPHTEEGLVATLERMGT